MTQAPVHVVPDLKCPCQKCGQNIAFPASARGQRLDCPHCGWPTVLGTPSPAVVVSPSAPATSSRQEDASKLAGLLIVAGMIGFAWFAFGHQTSVSTASGQSFNNFGLLAQQLGGFIASATAVLSGIGILILNRLPR